MDKQEEVSAPSSSPTSWRELKKMKHAELKLLCKELKVKVDGRKDDLIDRICTELGISKSGEDCIKVEPEATSSFDSNTKQQYLSLGKLSSIGGEWCRDLSLVPEMFDLESIKEYLVESNDKTFDHQSVRAYKSLRAWSLSQGGHVIMMNVNNNANSEVFMFVRAYCLPSQSTTHVYPVHVCLDKRVGVVYGAECRCVAGLGECCSHVAAVLFRLDDLLSQGQSTVPDGLSCTESACSWIAPANAAKIQAEPINEVQIYKPVLGKAKPVPKEVTLENFNPVALQDVEASPERVGVLVANLRQSLPTCTFATMFSGEHYAKRKEAVASSTASCIAEYPSHIDYFEMAPSAEVTVSTSASAKAQYNSPEEAAVSSFLNLRESIDTSRSPSTTAVQCVLEALQHSLQHSRQIEQETRGQSINNQWFYHRVGRISSSRSHQIANLRDSTDPGPILDIVFGCTDRSSTMPVPKPSVHTAAMSHGQKMEPIARREYIQAMKKKGTPISVVLTGLFVDAEHPWLASSPDGLVSDESVTDKFGVLEIKCPFSTDPVEKLAEASTFYLHTTNEGLQLKTSHPYYSQVQHHMAVVGRGWCDFVVLTTNSAERSKSLAIVRVPRNESFWAQHFPKLQNFFLSVIVPDIEHSAAHNRTDEE